MLDHLSKKGSNNTDSNRSIDKNIENEENGNEGMKKSKRKTNLKHENEKSVLEIFHTYF